MDVVFIDAINDLLGLDIGSLDIDRTHCNEERTNSQSFVRFESNNNKHKFERASILSIVESLTAVQMAKLKDARGK